MGLATFFTQWPFLILFHYTGWETFEWPTSQILTSLLANALLDTLLNTAIYVRLHRKSSIISSISFCIDARVVQVGIMYTSALFISVGQVLVMPASIIADFFFNHYVLPWPAFIGIGLVVAGYFFMNF